MEQHLSELEGLAPKYRPAAAVCASSIRDMLENRGHQDADIASLTTSSASSLPPAASASPRIRRMFSYLWHFVKVRPAAPTASEIEQHAAEENRKLAEEIQRRAQGIEEQLARLEVLALQKEDEEEGEEDENEDDDTAFSCCPCVIRRCRARALESSQRVEMFARSSSKVIRISGLALIGLFLGSKFTFAMLRFRLP